VNVASSHQVLGWFPCLVADNNKPTPGQKKKKEIKKESDPE